MSDVGGEWRSKAGPWARAVLPDGQELDVIVTARTRTADGVWWYECEVIMPVRYTTADGRTTAKGAPTPISVPSHDITPIPGERYDGLPTDGAVTGRQWVLEKRYQYTDDSPAHRLHRRDCWQAGPEYVFVTTAEAARLAGEPTVECCDVCAPQRALDR